MNTVIIQGKGKIDNSLLKTMYIENYIKEVGKMKKDFKEFANELIRLFNLKDDEDTLKEIVCTLEETCIKHNINIRILEENFKHIKTVIEKISLSVKEIIVFLER